jgi:hypothetical protein
MTWLRLLSNRRRSGYCQAVALRDVDRWRLNVEEIPAVARMAKRNQWDAALLKDTR